LIYFYFEKKDEGNNRQAEADKIKSFLRPFSNHREYEDELFLFNNLRYFTIFFC
jgi:hypothetical protein